MDEEERLPCFPASASVNPVMPAMAAGADDAALFKASLKPYTKLMLGVGLATLIWVCLVATSAATFEMASSRALPEICSSPA